mmetsp:Transcript_93483/g.302121  ORF Transcript_93483/g.302121 Transcript_93483/m.302121 type:complete len:215 (-) Transcript_93483:301-945(-)
MRQHLAIIGATMKDLGKGSAGPIRLPDPGRSIGDGRIVRQVDRLPNVGQEDIELTSNAANKANERRGHEHGQQTGREQHGNRVAEAAWSLLGAESAGSEQEERASQRHSPRLQHAGQHGVPAEDEYGGVSDKQPYEELQEGAAVHACVPMLARWSLLLHLTDDLLAALLQPQWGLPDLAHRLQQQIALQRGHTSKVQDGEEQQQLGDGEPAARL